MVILGGMATAGGPVAGTFVFLLVEDMLSAWIPIRFVREHWQLFLGPLLVLSVLFFRRGLAGILGKHDG
jgi:branched-chain amino acid transport system permease protein